MQMIDAGIEREGVCSLNDSEAEAVPMKRIRCRHDVLSQVRARHLAMCGRNKFDIRRIGDAVPNDVVGISKLEPAAVCIVPTKVRIDDIGHGAQIAVTKHLNGRNEQPRVIEPPGSLLRKAPNLSGLYITGRHSTHRRCKGFRARGRCWVPRN
ncbi:Uncharacterised protein [Mycobacterium tuberculosis]|uniref:Uncharacterized protein n=1 Tax=Mycobacterium tuberculosis TaxID=1773 RepID=A0A0U0SUI0_MYCTX|nr:Uncharacterised protein [Mycobacterium tuberculosis]